MRRVYILFLLTLTSTTWAEVYLGYDGKNRAIAVVRGEDRSTYKIDDSVCLVYKKNTVACGPVGRLTDRVVVIHSLLSNPLLIARGESVSLAKIWSPQPEPSDALEVIDARAELPYDNRSISVLALYPISIGLHLEQGVSRRVTLGVLPTLFNHALGNGKIEGAGFAGTVNFYSESLYEGWWAQLAVGEKIGKVSNSQGDETSGSLVVTPAVGYRMKSEGGAHFGVQVGGDLYLNRTLTRNIDTGYGLVVPTVRLVAGITF